MTSYLKCLPASTEQHLTTNSSSKLRATMNKTHLVSEQMQNKNAFYIISTLTWRCITSFNQ